MRHLRVFRDWTRRHEEARLVVTLAPPQDKCGRANSVAKAVIDVAQEADRIVITISGHAEVLRR